MIPRHPATSATFTILGAFFCLLLSAIQVIAQTPQYSVTDLGVFTARAVNNSGQVVGSSGNRAILYQNGVIQDITPSGGAIAEAHAINNYGQVVGQVFFCDIVGGNCVNSRTRAFIYANGNFTILGTLGGRDSLAFDINDAGQVAGYSDIPGPGPDISGGAHAFIYKDGVFEDIGIKIGAPSSYAFSINATGQAAGYSSSNSTNRGSFLYSNGTILFFEPRGIAARINNMGQVVGTLSGNDDGSGRAYLFSGGVVQSLGTLSSQHTYSSARSISNTGQVVGLSSQSFFTRADERAFIHSGGQMQDLNSLIPANSGWVLTIASDINDAGQIVGNGLFNGQERAFLLTPIMPVLLTEPNSNKAIALDSVTFVRDPFSLTNPYNFSADRRTRITLFARNVEFLPGETNSSLTVQAEDVQHRLFSLPVEYIGKVPTSNWLTQIVVRLPDEFREGGEIRLSITVRDRVSNKATINIEPSP